MSRDEIKEEIKTFVDEFAAAAVENARGEAIKLVNRALDFAGPAGLSRMMANMSVGEILKLGQSLSVGWEEVNAANAARIAAQKAALAQILAVLINAGAASMMVEMN